MLTTVLYIVLAVLIHFVSACDDIYRFTPPVMDESFRGLAHSIDERIPIERMSRMVKFYAQLMKVWGTQEMFIQERSIQT
jgi:acetylornithine deacetylase/succinyl-diaminopimelate desuccinylase-like protein